MFRLEDRNCAGARAAISAGQDGEAGDVELAAAERHVAGCPACAEYRDAVRRLSARLAAAPSLEASGPLWAPRRVRRGRRPLTVAGAVASLAVAAVLGAQASTLWSGAQAQRMRPELRVAVLDPQAVQAVEHDRRLRQLHSLPDIMQKVEQLRERVG